MTTHADYLDRPLRSLDQARRDCERARELDNLIKGAQSGPNPLRRLAEYHAPDPARVLADRQATRAATKRRRLGRYAHCLAAELRDHELTGKGLHEEERMSLMTLLVEIRRALG